MRGVRAVSAWQDISTAPKDRTVVLVFIPLFKMSTRQPAFWNGKDWIHSWDHEPLAMPPSHWQPLPEPPDAP